MSDDNEKQRSDALDLYIKFKNAAPSINSEEETALSYVACNEGVNLLQHIWGQYLELCTVKNVDPDPDLEVLFSNQIARLYIMVSMIQEGL